MVATDSPHSRPHATTEGFAGFPEASARSSIGRRFQKVASRHADRIALRAGARQIDYRTLNEQARRIAAGLHHRTPADTTGRVVLLIEDPLLMVPAILGTLMAGRVYVPLDPGYPPSRLRYMMSDAAPDLVLTDGSTDGAALPEGVPVHDIRALLTMPPLLAADIAGGDRIASLLYTSGSTGVPKGVLQSHRNIMFHVRNLTELFQISPTDRHSVVASFSFDASTTDLYCALLNGASLVVIDVRRDGLLHLPRRLAEYGVTLLHATPTVFRRLDDPATPRLPDLRLILLGGEPVTARDVQIARRLSNPDCLFVNGYGATETGGFLSLHVLRASDPAPDAVVPVGHALPGIELSLEPGTAGDEGELIARSAHLGVGYWGDNEATAATFGREPHPAGLINVYRSGDRATMESDGAFRLTGRRDRQVKVNGVRVDPAEIENALRSLTGNAQVAVRPYDAEGGPQLIGYLVGADGRPDLAAVRTGLAERLPAYLVPQQLVIVDALPLTPTGKVDYGALPIPQPPAVVLPVTGSTADAVAAIWCATLGVDAVGRDQNFFDVGGRSLLMAEVHRQVEGHFQRAIPLYQLFEHPTVHRMSALIEGLTGVRERDAAMVAAVQARVAGRRRSLARPHRIGYDRTTGTTADPSLSQRPR